MTLRDYLAAKVDRCPSCQWHPPTMGHSPDCAPVAPEIGSGITDAEWAIFVGALRTAAVDGRVSQTDMRPLIRGRIYHKHIGLAYRRAKAEGLLTPVGKEDSTDAAGGNTDKEQNVYELRAA